MRIVTLITSRSSSILHGEHNAPYNFPILCWNRSSIVGFGFDTILLALTVLGSWRHALMAKQLGAFGGSPLMYVLMRDGILVYVSILCKWTNRTYYQSLSICEIHPAIFVVSLVTSIIESPSRILHAWCVLLLDIFQLLVFHKLTHSTA